MHAASEYSIVVALDTLEQRRLTMARHNTQTHSLTISKRDHACGPAHAPILIVHYGDYECRDSAEAFRMIRDAQHEPGADVRYVFRHFPLRAEHPRAQRAAEAAEAAAAQGRFWEMHELLFEHQQALTDRHLRNYGAMLGLDAVRFDCELAARVYGKRVRVDVSEGVKNGVEGTPTFFINGVRYQGLANLPELLRAVAPVAA